MSNSLDPDQDRHFVGPDLGPNCLQSYQKMTKFAASRQRGEDLLCDYITCHNIAEKIHTGTLMVWLGFNAS